MKCLILSTLLPVLVSSPSFLHRRASFMLGRASSGYVLKATRLAGSCSGSPSTVVQLARVDFVHQYTSTHTNTSNYDNGKGIDFIPFTKTEVDFQLAWIHPAQYSQGAGWRWRFLRGVKYRPFAANEKKGNYSTLVQLAFSASTGSYKNGTAVSTITPTVVAGKDYRKFDVQSALEGVLPTSSVLAIDRTIQWSTTAQYKIGKYFWPELEANTSYFRGGANDGKSQVFLTPGLIVSKLKLRKDPKDRLGFVLGTGMQIATSSSTATTTARSSEVEQISFFPLLSEVPSIIRRRSHLRKKPLCVLRQ